MNENSKKILLSFQGSTKRYWTVKEDEVRAIIQTAVETDDVDLLLFFISSPPKDDPGTGWGPGTVYIQLCQEVIFPYLAEHVTLPIAQAVCNSLIENNIGYKDYNNAAFSVLEHAGLTALKPVCDMVVSRSVDINTWKQAVGLLRGLGQKEAIPAIIEGMKTVRPNWNSVNGGAMGVGVQALMALDAPDQAAIFYDLLSQDDEFVRRGVIAALAHYGDDQALQALNKRLGGIFTKPEKIPYIRKEITTAIEKIKTRKK
jgi:hypothetical protein